MADKVKINLRESPTKYIPKKWDIETDVVIVGSGFSGLAASIEAHDAGADVVLVEKMSTVGGNSIISNGGYNAVDPERQGPQGIKDSVDLHYKHTIEGGGSQGEPEKVRFLVEHALEGLHWLEEMGVKFSPKVVQSYGGLWPRDHHVTGPRNRGAGIVAALLNQIKKRGIPLLLEHKVIRIIRKKPLEGRVIGVTIEAGENELYYKAKKALILASGGFGADVKMRMQYNPRLNERVSTSNHSGATGECIKMAFEIGADLKGMEFIQCIGLSGRDIRKGGVIQRAPITRVLPLIPPNRYIITNLKGERIVASDAKRDTITESVMATEEKVVFIIGDDKCREAGGISLEDAAKLAKKFLTEIFMGETIRELATKAEMNPNILEQTISKFNSYVCANFDPDFGQAPHNLQYKIEKKTFWAGTGSPSVHFTMGGLTTKGASTQVIDRRGKVIPGFYAAGEVTGGVHGNNRLGGNAIPDCIVFGRVAGKNAAEEKP